MDKKEILKACRELLTISAGITRTVERLATEEPAPRKPPARAGKVIEMRRAVGE